MIKKEKESDEAQVIKELEREEMELLKMVEQLTRETE